MTPPSTTRRIRSRQIVRPRSIPHDLNKDPNTPSTTSNKHIQRLTTMTTTLAMTIARAAAEAPFWSMLHGMCIHGMCIVTLVSFRCDLLVSARAFCALARSNAHDYGPYTSCWAQSCGMQHNELEEQGQPTDRPNSPTSNLPASQPARQPASKHAGRQARKQASIQTRQQFFCLTKVDVNIAPGQAPERIVLHEVPEPVLRGSCWHCRWY